MTRGNPEALRRSADRKRQETLEKAERGIQQLIKDKKPINFNTVAEVSEVSRAWLYSEPEVKSRIEALRKQSAQKKEVPIKQRPSEVSKAVLIRTLKERIKRLDIENKDLRRQNEVTYGHVQKVRDRK
jgi:translation initiation factor 2B subunit (eIF-2B alpha/beta/delta family)